MDIETEKAIICLILTFLIAILIGMAIFVLTENVLLSFLIGTAIFNILILIDIIFER